MKIGINALFRGNPTGVPNYICSLVHHLAEIDSKNEYVVLTTPQNMKYFRDDAENLTRLPCAAASENPAYRRLWEQFVLPAVVRGQKFDVLHCPMNVIPLAPGCPTVLTIIDMQYFMNPQDFTFLRRTYLKYMMRASWKRAQAALTISGAVRDEVHKFFDSNNKEIQVIHFGVSSYFRVIDDGNIIDDIKKKYGITGKYIIFPGYPHYRKNLPRLVRAFAQALPSLPEPYSLILAGDRGTFESDSPNIDQAVSECKIEDHVIFTGHIPIGIGPQTSEIDMAALLNGADLLVFPSLYEGFGLPVIEAMACGTPVMAGAIPALEEVAGDAAIYVDPHDQDDIARAISRALTDVELRGRLISLGLERAKEFTWQNNARKTLKCYEEVVEKASARKCK